MVKFNFNLVPKKAIEYLRNKGYKLSFDYFEIEKQAHDRAFTVAKITRLDLLHDMQNAIEDAMKNGKTYKQFEKEIKPTLQKKGWWGEQDITNPKTGEIKTIKVDSHRLRRIYKTNMQVAYAKARYEEQMKLPNSTYLQYVSALLETTRDEHAAAHGTILPRDDIWWDTNYPINGHGPCYCKTRAVSEKWMKKRGLKVSQRPTTNVASKDWAYHVGKVSKLGIISNLNLDASLSSLTLINSIKKEELKNMSEEELKNRFYKTMGIKEGEIFIDKVNDPMNIDDNLFSSAKGHTKIKKRDRHLYLDEIAKTIKDPDEIYLEFKKGNLTKENSLYKKMFRYINDNGKKRAIMVVFEYLKDKTQGVTAYYLDNGTQVEKRRVEKLIYKRESD
jgi:SPP1 gp7 family putative phage head morphogenesis protein